MTVAFLVAAGVVALGDWFAVSRRRHRIEYVAKPLTLALIAGAACFADLGAAKPWVIAALVFGLLGDIALLFTDLKGSTALYDRTGDAITLDEVERIAI